jgi:F-type H+-transporting ATPase subunit b
MKRWTSVAIICAALVLALGSIAPAAESSTEGGEATSPLYQPNQGVITGTITIVIFVLLLAVLGKYSWGPIVKGLKSREDKIRKDIADADAARSKAEALLRDYNKQLADAEARAQALIAKASADAEALAAQIRARGQQEAEEARERATKEIEAAKNQAIREIHEQAADLATSAAEKIIRRSLNPNDYRDLVNQSLEQLQTMGR